MKTERYPIDFDKLEKGSYITPEVAERVIGMSRKEFGFGLKLLALLDEIQRHLKTEDKVWTLRVWQSGIKICTDPEAAKYNADQADKARNRLRRLHFQNLAVETANLSKDEKKLHLHTLQVEGKILQAIKREQNRFRLPDSKHKALKG